MTNFQITLWIISLVGTAWVAYGYGYHRGRGD